MADPVLVAEDYSFWFKPAGGRPEGPPALRDVNLTIEAGSFVLVLGRSGSGKSTLALNLVGIYPDYFDGRNSGRIEVRHAEKGLVNRREIGAGERFKTVNMLFQNPEDQIVTLTVEEEVGFAMENYLYEPADIHSGIDRALDLVGLTGFRERSTLQLSGGEKQRVALAAILALEPTLLILDEPTSNLDPAGTADVLETLDSIRERIDLTLMVIEHEVDVVFDRVDTVLLVEDHEVTGPFTPREFITDRGLHVRDKMGLWIPQASEVGLELKRVGVSIPEIPLNGDELVETLTRMELGLPPTHRSITAGSWERVSEALSSPAAPTPDAPASGETVIEVRDVSFSYADHPVLEGVNLTARRDELLAILGQNGSGKSTLASLFNGIEQPNDGEILVDGKPTVDYEFAQLVKRVAYIFQVPEKQFIANTVYDEIAHGIRSLGLDEDTIHERTLELLETVRLLERRDASPYVLSHGQKRRLSVASMVVTQPEVVVLDEPTFGQDYYQAQNLMNLLKTLAENGTAVIFITHDMRLVAEYADRAAVLCDRSTIFEGSPADLFANNDVLTRSRLRAPAVFHFSKELVGSHILTTPALSSRIEELIDA